MKITLDNFIFSRAAYFFRLKSPLKNKEIKEIFDTVSQHKEGRILINIIKASNSAYVYSLCLFKIHNEPSFLVNSGITEERYAFLLIIEYDNKLVIAKKNIPSLPKLLINKIENYPIQYFYSLFSQKSPTYEKLHMRSNSLSNNMIRQMSLEAVNLNTIIPAPLIARSIATKAKMRVETESVSINPTTSMISTTGNPVGINEFLLWVESIFTQLESDEVTQTQNTLLHRFSTPISLNKLKENSDISGIFIDISRLEEEMTENIKITYNSKPLDEIKLKRLFHYLRKTLIIKNNKHIRCGLELFALRINKSTISLRSRLLDKLIIHYEDESRITMTRYINTKYLFSVSFSKPQYIYAGRGCFEDRNICKNTENLFAILDTSLDFKDILSEKESNKLQQSTTEFPHTSLFSRIEKKFSTHNILICDDMRDEWADHIAINSKEIIFIHSKFNKTLGCSASALHEVISQALKNIGMLSTYTTDYMQKYDEKWMGYYEDTKIPRCRTTGKESSVSDRAYLSEMLSTINTNPNSLRKMIIAVPFLSKNKLREEIEKENMKPHIIQIIWLLNSFIGSCIDNNIQPYILCAD